MKYKYRIEVRTLSNDNKKYQPQRCALNPRLSVLNIIFNTKPRERWLNITNPSIKNQEYDRGYDTLEKAREIIDNDKAKNVEVVAVSHYYDYKNI